MRFGLLRDRGCPLLAFFVRAPEYSWLWSDYFLRYDHFTDGWVEATICSEIHIWCLAALYFIFRLNFFNRLQTALRKRVRLHNLLLIIHAFEHWTTSFRNCIVCAPALITRSFMAAKRLPSCKHFFCEFKPLQIKLFWRLVELKN